MKYKKITIVTYIAVFVACIWSCTQTAMSLTKSEYEKTIETISYQMSAKNVYATKESVETAAKAEDKEDIKKTIYLTFDDGPSARTKDILELLAQYDIRATFFVVNTDNEEYKQYMKDAYSQGHCIGVHTASHKYKLIYKSVQNYIDDFEKCYNFVYENTGEYPTIFRFPGGSVNNFNKSNRNDIIAEMKRRGFVYFDWNVCSGDATSKNSVDEIYNEIMRGCAKLDNSVVLCHDSTGKKNTVAALKKAIPLLLEQGYTFDKLDENAKPVVFKI